MEHLSKKERKKLRLEKLRDQSRLQQLEQKHREEQHIQFEESKKAKKKKIYRILYFTAIIILVIVGVYAYMHYFTPGKFDNFARCLTEKGAVMYGAIEWCSYTQEQAGMFGKSFKYVNYKDYKEIEGVTVTPTWVINGERYPKVQTFDTLSRLTGCDWRSR